MKQHTDFDELAAELEVKYPEEMEAARIWAEDLIQRHKNGENVFDIRQVTFTDGNMDYLD